MDFYHKRENVDLYKEMTQSYDPASIVAQVKEYVPIGSTLLELGMGPGIDLIALSKYYHVTGSDYSPLFLEDFRKTHPDIEILEGDAANFAFHRQFDCIYSNKVLHHLSVEDFKKSLQLQAEHLKEAGIVFMTLWHGTFREEFYEGLRFMYYTEENIRDLIPKEFRIETIEIYTELEPEDSLLVILRKRGKNI